MRLFALICFLFLGSFPAKAEVFVWTDPEFGITLSFPETWMRQAQAPGDLKLHILAPQGMDLAACRVFASDDGRFLYVPPRGQYQVSQLLQDSKTLSSLLQNRLGYSNVKLVGYQDIGGLGKGPATVAVAEYNKNWNGKDYAMKSIQFGGYIDGIETMFHCEALSQAWGRWVPLFMNMVKSFDFPAQYGATAEMNRLMHDPKALDEILVIGAEKANDLAAPMVSKTMDIMGFWKP